MSAQASIGFQLSQACAVQFLVGVANLIMLFGFLGVSQAPLQAGGLQRTQCFWQTCYELNKGSGVLATCWAKNEACQGGFPSFRGPDRHFGVKGKPCNAPGVRKEPICRNLCARAHSGSSREHGRRILHQGCVPFVLPLNRQEWWHSRGKHPCCPSRSLALTVPKVVQGPL